MVLMNFEFLVFGVTDYAGKITTSHYGAVAAREPRAEEVKDACRLLGRRLAEWVAVVADGRKDQHPLAKSEARTPAGGAAAPPRESPPPSGWPPGAALSPLSRLAASARPAR